MSVVQSSAIRLSVSGHADYLSTRGKERTSMFFKRGRGMEFVKAGSIFRRNRNDYTVETARILSVASDSFGIPHVKYELAFEKPSSASSRVVDGPRVLALAAFAEMYRDRVAS